MRKTSFRISGALVLVLISLTMASLACYSGQIPGVFELTPFSTPTQIPKVENAQFKLLETVLAPHEDGFTFFNMTLFPEPLEPSLLNSKSLCEKNSPAQILFAGTGENDITYYLVDCTGSVGWAAEFRLAGPLKFQQQDLALTVSENGQPLQMLDPSNFTPLMSFMQCLPETVVNIQNIQAADADGDGAKEVYYLIECPMGNKGYVGNEDLFGPVKVNVKDRALAIAAEGNDAKLASEAAPVTEANLVGDCADGSVVTILSAQRVENTAYFEVECGEIEGWTEQANLIGPLKFNPEDFMIIYVPPQLVFIDELPSDVAGEIAVVGEGESEGEGGSGGESESETPPEGEGSEGGAEEIRTVVEYTSPAYLTNVPGPVIREGADANVAGQCESGADATIFEYAGFNDVIYYRIGCDLCVEFSEANADGNVECLVSEPQEGWIEQTYLQGPLDYIPGDMVMLKSSSKAIMTEEATGSQYARIPSTTTGASAIGDYTAFAGRCLYEDGLEITGVVLEKARTSNKFAFYFAIQCEGQAAVTDYVTDHEGKTRPVISYNTEATGLVSGYALGRDLVPMGE